MSLPQITMSVLESKREFYTELTDNPIVYAAMNVAFYSAMIDSVNDDGALNKNDADLLCEHLKNELSRWTKHYRRLIEQK